MIKITAKIGKEYDIQEILPSAVGNYQVKITQSGGEQTNPTYMTENLDLKSLENRVKFISQLKSYSEADTNGFYPFSYAVHETYEKTPENIPVVLRYGGTYEYNSNYLRFSSSGQINLTEHLTASGVENLLTLNIGFFTDEDMTNFSTVTTANSSSKLSSLMSNHTSFIAYNTTFQYTKPTGTYTVLTYYFELFVHTRMTSVYPELPTFYLKPITNIFVTTTTQFNGYGLSLQINNKIRALYLKFDTSNDNYPSHIVVSHMGSGLEKTIQLNSPTVFITGLNEIDNYLDIRIPDWNEPDSPLVITEIRPIIDDIYINVDRNNLLSVDSNIVYRADNKMASWGIISNRGNLSLKDTSGELLYFADEGLLIGGIETKIFLHNTLSKKTEQIGAFLTDVWNYDNNNNEVSVSLKDDLEEWQNIYVEGYSYDPRNINYVLDMYSFYKWLHKETPLKYKMLSVDELDEDTKTILRNTEIKYPMLKSGYLWSQWQKLCEVCALYIYKNHEGKTVCSYTYGS